ncbi:MAG: nuclear transport factor 2 family protein [Planctomycetes bacterium]|nr:nuclear transport factor 2 family protein [Planctomycetota bacterium]
MTLHRVVPCPGSRLRAPARLAFVLIFLFQAAFAQEGAGPREGKPLGEMTRWIRVAQPEPEAAPEPPSPAPPIDLADFHLLVREIFEAYERESVGAFAALIHPDFLARDRTGNDYRYADMPRALSDDFEILERIAFTVFVGQVTVESDGGRAQVEVRWSRRARVEIGGQEIIVTDQRSVFQFDRPPGGTGFLLSRIFGDPIFGLADRRGEITVDRGTLDGELIRVPILLDRFQGIVRPPLVQRDQDGGAGGGGGGGGPPPSTILLGTNTILEGQINFDTQVFQNSFLPFLPGADIQWSPNPGPLTGFILPSLGTVREITGMFANLDAIAVLPAPPYADLPALNENAADVGRLFAVQTDQGFFCGFEITAYNPLPAPAGEWTLRFKYQTDGTRNLQ